MKRYISFIKYLSIVFFFLLIVACTKETEITTENVSKPEQTTESTDEKSISEELPLIKINKGDELIVAVRYDYGPYMWVENNNFKGFLVDVEKTILKRMGQNYIFVEFTNAEKVVMDLKDGKVHCTIGVPKIQDYEQLFNLADSYLTVTWITLVHKDTNDIGGSTREEVIQSLFGKTVGVQARGVEYNMLREYKEINLIEYETGTVALEKLANKEVDAKVEVKEIALHLAKINGWDIKPVGVPLDNSVVAMGFSKRVDPEIIGRYNAALKSIQDDGTYDKIYNSWFGE